MTLVFCKSSGMVELRPSAEGLADELLGLVEGVAESLKNLPCLYTAETGYSRQGEPEGRSRVFPECMADLVPKALVALRLRLHSLLRLPSATGLLLAQHAKILGQDSKKYSAWLKSGEHSIAVFASELARLAQARQHVEELLFESPLCLGPFVIHCSGFKDQLVAKVEDLSAVLFGRIKKSVAKTSGRIEVEVERILGVLNNEKIRDIEELSEVKAFIRRLPEARRGIGGIIKEVNHQIALLEQYQCRRTEEEV